MSTENADIQDAISDANRTLRKKNKGDGYYVVTRMDCMWSRYDPEKDGPVPGGKFVISVIPTPVGSDGLLNYDETARGHA